MTVYTSLEQTLDTIEKSSTDDDVWKTLFRFLKMCHVNAVQYHHLPSPGSADFGHKSTLKQVFQQVDDKESIENLFSKVSPFQGDADFLKDHAWCFSQGILTSATQDEKDSETHNGLRGLSFAVHGPLGRSGYFTLVGGSSCDAFSDNEVRVMKWTCQNTHQALCKIKMLNLQKHINLTDREIEILSWIARGKSNSVIAEILGISPHTVNTYVRRIFLKTGTNDRTSACLFGISNGLVSL